MEILIKVPEKAWHLLSLMAPYLLMGYLFAGFIHAFIPQESIYKHLSSGKFKSIVKATLVGIPLPLCSCGVLPVAEMLRSLGATPGAVMAFLLSTPTTGIDSILATYSLLGLPITVMRIMAATCAGMLSGIITNLTVTYQISAQPRICCCCKQEELPEQPRKFKEALRYGFSQLIVSTRKWIAVGIIIGALIEVLIPQRIVQFLTSHGLSYLAAMVVAIPTYVCATGSVPIAAGMVAKGFPAGAAIVFLVAGPASNTVSISFVKSRLGGKALIIYLTTIAAVSLLFGFATDVLVSSSGWKSAALATKKVSAIHSVSGIILLILFILAGRW